MAKNYYASINGQKELIGLLQKMLLRQRLQVYQFSPKVVTRLDIITI